MDVTEQKFARPENYDDWTFVGHVEGCDLWLEEPNHWRWFWCMNSDEFEAKLGFPADPDEAYRIGKDREVPKPIIDYCLAYLAIIR